MPGSLPCPRAPNSFWRKARLYFNRAQGRGDALEQAWAQQLRQNPNAIQPALEFLDALLYARSAANQRQQPNLFWMTEVLKPTRATEASDLASRLQNLQNWPAAIAFYRKAIVIPLTPDEISKMGMMRQVMIPGDTLRASFDAQVRESLAQCLLATGDAAEAQKWMVQAQDIREKHNLSRNASLAGQVQARSNQRTIEARIQAEEKTSEDDPKYWTERAQYYAGRNEPAQQEEALKRALALTVPKPRPERGFKGYIDWRGSCLQQYANFLQQQKRIAEAANLLLDEIKTAPAEADSSSTAVRLIVLRFQILPPRRRRLPLDLASQSPQVGIPRGSSPLGDAPGRQTRRTRSILHPRRKPRPRPGPHRAPTPSAGS